MTSGDARELVRNAERIAAEVRAVSPEPLPPGATT